MDKKVLYMLMAVLASALLFVRPVFSFQDDKGIIYVRSFSMDSKMFYVTQTEMKTGMEEVVSTMSVKGLYICTWLLLATCLAALLCLFDDFWRMMLCVLAAALAGVYYLLMVYYAVQITDRFYTTLYPNLMAVLPAIVLQLMLLVRRDIAHDMMIANEDEEKEEEPQD